MDFAMCIADQGQAKRSDAMSIHRERGFAPDLIDPFLTNWATALRVAAGAADLTLKAAPCPYSRCAVRGFPRHLTARASHDVHLESVRRAWR
jgi:hypothetical protein